MASSSTPPVSSALQLKKAKQQSHLQEIPLLLPSSKHQLGSRQKVILQQRNESRQHRCSELLDTVLESLAPFKHDGQSLRPHNRCMCTKMKSGSSAASPALTSYFHTISMEKDLFDIDECRVVVDNAHIPLECDLPLTKGDLLDMQDPRAFHERMSRSHSDIPIVSCPPGLLQLQDGDSPHDSPASRWESFNSSSSSCDFSLSVPTRTLDMDEDPTFRKVVDPAPPTPPLRAKRRNLVHAISLDSTARLLRQLPMESSTHSASAHSSGSRFSKSETELSEDLQDLPELSAFNQFESHNEAHPRAAMRRLSEESLDMSTSFLSDSIDDESLVSFGRELQEEKHGSEDAEESFDEPHSLPSVSFDRWSVHSPSKSPSKHCISFEKIHETPSTEWPAKKLNFLAHHHVSPRILADFPLATSFASSYKLSDDESMGEIFETTERILDLRSQYKQG